MINSAPDVTGGSVFADSGIADDEIDALESVMISPSQVNSVDLILNGTLAPLQGFMTRADRESVANNFCLARGAPFPLPLSLSISAARAEQLTPGTRVALRDGEGLAVAVLHCDDVWPNENEGYFLGGIVKRVAPIFQPFFGTLRPSPEELRKKFESRGFERVIAADPGDLINRDDHAHIVGLAESLDMAILLSPVIGVPNAEDRNQARQIKCHLAALDHFPGDRTELAMLAGEFGNGGSREMLLHALMRRNLGATYLTMKSLSDATMRADAGTDAFLESIGMTMVPWPKRVFLPAIRRFVDQAEAGTDQETVTDDQLLNASVGQIRSLEGIAFPEVAAVLEDYASEKQYPGLTIFFTGLSGSGKSTIAKIVVARLAEQTAQPVTLFDGDIVRQRFSADLGFSKADRDTNICRIGAAAAEITAAGGITVCCAIAPYQQSRRAVRKMIEEHGAMIEVYVDTPLAVCERRDPKGLYKKARKGIIAHFTGVDDPYENPVNPEIRVHTVQETPSQSAENVLTFLAVQGYLRLSGVVNN